jgi:hypothetical protein
MPIKPTIPKNIRAGHIKSLNVNDIPIKKNYSSNSGKEKIKLFKALKFIDSHCSEFLSSMKKSRKILYHGFRTEDISSLNGIFIGKPWHKRIPKDSDLKLQQTLDFIMNNEGFSALRGNSIFCTSKQNKASDFGHVFLIFPLNGFSYSYSGGHYDLMLSKNNFFAEPYNSILSNLVNIINEYQWEIYPGNLPISMLKNDQNLFCKTIQTLYSLCLDNPQSLIELLNPDSIIRKHLKVFFFLLRKYPYLERADEILVYENAVNSLRLHDYSKYIIEKLNLKDTNLSYALEYGYEIYINGTYVAIQCYHHPGELDIIDIIKKYYKI